MLEKLKKNAKLVSYKQQKSQERNEKFIKNQSQLTNSLSPDSSILANLLPTPSYNFQQSTENVSQPQTETMTKNNQKPTEILHNNQDNNANNDKNDKDKNNQQKISNLTEILNIPPNKINLSLSPYENTKMDLPNTILGEKIDKLPEHNTLVVNNTDLSADASTNEQKGKNENATNKLKENLLENPDNPVSVQKVLETGHNEGKNLENLENPHKIIIRSENNNTTTTINNNSQLNDSKSEANTDILLQLKNSDLIYVENHDNNSENNGETKHLSTENFRIGLTKNA